MRKFFILSALFASGVLFAQNPTISQRYSDAEIATLIRNYANSRNHDTHATGVLQQNFQQHFPRAQSVEWETNGEIFEAEFKINRRDFKAFYDKDGNLLMFVQDIRASELPAIVRTAAEARFPKYRFEDIEKVVKGTRTFFKIEMEHRNHEVTMFILNDGTFLNETIRY